MVTDRRPIQRRLLTGEQMLLRFFDAEILDFVRKKCPEITP